MERNDMKLLTLELFRCKHEYAHPQRYYTARRLAKTAGHR
jgi:hypothetical protein